MYFPKNSLHDFKKESDFLKTDLQVVSKLCEDHELSVLTLIMVMYNPLDAAEFYWLKNQFHAQTQFHTQTQIRQYIPSGTQNPYM